MAMSFQKLMINDTHVMQRPRSFNIVSYKQQVIIKRYID